MSTQDIVQKLWNLCNVLRDDGITYHQYVTELTYILFLKMLNETGEEERLISSVREAYAKKLEAYAKKHKKPVEALEEKEKDDLKGALYLYSWDYLASLEGIELKKYYNKLYFNISSKFTFYNYNGYIKLFTYHNSKFIYTFMAIYIIFIYNEWICINIIFKLYIFK